jgi:methyltransferase (TIGR00027 family)
MKADLPSRTAQLVALGRAMADAGFSHVPGFHDPTARLFIDEKGKQALEKTVGAIRAGKRSWRVGYARVMADMMALRTTAIDMAVRDAIARGAKQLVILGAGYDGRAWRMKELGGIKVFEVDHPATQGAKRERVNAAAPPAIGSVTFIPMNFETQNLREVLSKAGHDSSSPTCWIWEGVVMYLTPDAMRATLSNIAALSAAGSTVIINYHSEKRRGLMKLIFRLIGEPMISAWTAEQMAEELAAARFRVLEDTAMTDWNVKWAGGKANVARGHYMRVVVGLRR